MSRLSREPPLKGEGHLTVGYWDTFFLREGQKVDVGTLKLFLSRKQVNLSHVAQSSPFVPVGGRSTAPPSPPFVHVEGSTTPSPVNSSRSTHPPPGPGSGLHFPWDTIEIPVVQRRANTSRGFY
jgi:hypothetical protein